MSTSSSSVDVKTVEAWSEAKGTPSWLFSAARASGRWALGTELSETEYDAALRRAETYRLG